VTVSHASTLQATTLYAALLRQLAHQGVADLLTSCAAGTAPADGEAAALLASAASQLRAAAGVYTHLAEEELPSLLSSLRGDRCALQLLNP
jgi:hypothetical protein